MSARGEGVRADVVEVLPPTSPRMLNENGRSALLDPNVALGIPVVGRLISMGCRTRKVRWIPRRMQRTTKLSTSRG